MSSDEIIKYYNENKCSFNDLSKKFGITKWKAYRLIKKWENKDWI